MSSEAAENVFTALLRGYNKHRCMDTTVLDFDNLPVRSGGAADYPAQLSVVIPVYNVDIWLGYCLRSLQAQTFTAWEAWLIDDGSTDLSGRVCDNYATKDSRFHVLHQCNKGVGGARNTGIRKAKAQFLAFVDPDDILMPDYFQTQITAMKQHKAQISISRVVEIDQNGKYIDITRLITDNCKTHILPDSDSIRNAFGNLYHCAAWGRIFERKLWGDTLFPEGINLGEDVATVPFVFWSANRAVYVHEAVYAHRTWCGSLTQTLTYERVLLDLGAINYTIRMLCGMSPEMSAKLERLGMQWIIGRIHDFYRAQKKHGVISFLTFCESMLEEVEKRECNGFFKRLEDVQLERETSANNEMDPNERC